MIHVELLPLAISLWVSYHTEIVAISLEGMATVSKGLTTAIRIDKNHLNGVFGWRNSQRSKISARERRQGLTQGMGTRGKYYSNAIWVHAIDPAAPLIPSSRLWNPRNSLSRADTAASNDEC